MCSPELNIEFCVNGTKGIRVLDALSGNLNGLDHADTPVFDDGIGTKVSYRLEVSLLVTRPPSHGSNCGHDLCVDARI